MALDTWILGCWDLQLFLEAQRLKGQCFIPPGTERAVPAKAVLRRVSDGDGVGRIGRRALRTNVQSQQGANGRPRVSHKRGVAWEGLAPGEGCKALGPAWSRLDSLPLLAVGSEQQVTF